METEKEKNIWFACELGILPPFKCMQILFRTYNFSIYTIVTALLPQQTFTAAALCSEK